MATSPRVTLLAAQCRSTTVLWSLRTVTAIVISRSYLRIYEKAESFDRPLTPIGVPGADMTTAIAAHDPVDKDAADGHDDLLLAG